MILPLLLTILIGPEAFTERFPGADHPSGCSAAALATSGGEIVLAWSSGDRTITTTTLDQNLHEIAGRRTITTRPSVPVCLEAATSDVDTILVWRETRSLGFESFWGARFDHTGATLESPRSIAEVPASARPDVAWSPWNGGRYLVAAGSNWLEGSSGSPLAEFRSHEIGAWHNYGYSRSGYFDAVAPAATAFALSVRVYEPPGRRCGIPGYRCGWFGGETVVAASTPHWLWPSPVATVTAEDPAFTTIACMASDCLLFWGSPSGIQGRSLRSQASLSFATGPRSPSATMASASDGQRILLVWESPDSGRVSGVAISADGTEGPFVVAEGDYARRQPSVVSLGEGRFLVAYEVTPPQPAPVQLGGRTVEVTGDSPSRRRGVAR